jgi:hypothetical protein
MMAGTGRTSHARGRRRAALIGPAGGALAAAVALLAFAGSSSAASEAAPSNTSAPSISGTTKEDSTLHADRGDWSNDPDDYDYQWQRCEADGSDCGDISGATEDDYKLRSADVGKRVRVIVTATNADGSSSAASAPSAQISAAGTAPVNTAPPSISGTPQDNQTLTALLGSWGGSDPKTYSYTWRRCDANGNKCSDIAKGGTYKVTSRDVGHRLRVVVTAKNSVGSSSATSAATAVALAAGSGPKNTAKPTISGTAQDNQTLSASTGNWSGNGPITHSYQWQRCDANGNNCQSISGANGSSYRVTSNDVGRRLRVAVTAKNANGSATATSDASAIAVAASPAGANGATSIPVTSVSLPNRLIIDRVSFNPTVIRSRNQGFTARFRVVDSNGKVVRDALVYAVGVPANRVSRPPEARTDQTGWATLAYTPQRGLPLKRGARLTIFVRARKPGENLLGGVSTRRLVSIGVRPAR